MPDALCYITTAWNKLFAGHEVVFAYPQLESLSLLTAGKTTVNSRNIKCATFTLLVGQEHKEIAFLLAMLLMLFFQASITLMTMA